MGVGPCEFDSHHPHEKKASEILMLFLFLLRAILINMNLTYR